MEKRRIKRHIKNILIYIIIIILGIISILLLCNNAERIDKQQERSEQIERY